MTPLRLGYLPLIDAAPLIVAQELGFAAEESLRLELVRLGAWAQSRDMLGAGLIDAAHMLVPLPVRPDLPCAGRCRGRCVSACRSCSRPSWSWSGTG